MEGLVWLHQNLHSNSAVNEFVKFITRLGDTGFIWIVLGLIFLIFKKTRHTGIILFISLAVGFVLNDFVLKTIFNRARPFEVNNEFKQFIESLGMELPSGKSFPSGHSYSSLNCAMVITLMHKKWGWTSLFLGFAIALSRIFLLVHYPTDVLAGIILGIITAVCMVLVYKKILRVLEARKRQKVLKG